MFEFWLWRHLALIFGYLLAIAGIAHMLRQRRAPGSTMAWLLVFISLPYVGAALYLMFGGRKLQRRRRAALARFDRRRDAGGASTGQFDQALCSYGAAPASEGNQVELCRDGAEGYRRMVELISEARRRIYVLTYIFSDDAVGRDVLERLARRAAEGLDVRVLIDALGSLRSPPRFFRQLADAGGQFVYFQPVLHLPFRTRTNLRNHRKILVVDGERSFSGGMNITAEDIDPAPRDGGWRDLSLAIDGPAAGRLEEIFREDWQFATGQAWDGGEPAAPVASPAPAHSERVQILASGPDVPNDPMYAASLTAIFRATRRLWIVTPYFVPNDALVEALVFACQRGVDVRILIPAASNHRLSDLAGASLLRDIHAAGGTVLRYPKGMVHAKAMIVDDLFVAVGSANFDMRSLFLNYEVMQMCYSPRTIDAVSRWFSELAEDCRSDLPETGALRRLAERAVWAIAPMF